MNLKAWMFAATLAFGCVALAQDDLLGKKHGNHGSGNSGGSSNSSGNSNSGGGSRPKPKEGAPTRSGSNSNSGSNQSARDRTPPPGRQDSNSSSRSPFDTPRRSSQSRSGQVNYGSSNNRQTPQSQRQRFDTVPSRGNRISNEALRDNTRRGNTYRSGYYGYDNNWRDDNWNYPYYQFNYNNNCVASPWYYYPNMPGYVNCNRISTNGLEFIIDLFASSRDWTSHDWRYNDRYDRRSDCYELDSAVADLTRAFKNRDKKALGRLVPRGETIRIDIDGQERYGIDSDDYYDMMVDMISNTRTRRYDIESVRTHGSYVDVIAYHEFTDSWGERDSIWHRIVLKEDRNSYSITEFATSRYRMR